MEKPATLVARQAGGEVGVPRVLVDEASGHRLIRRATAGRAPWRRCWAQHARKGEGRDSIHQFSGPVARERACD